MRSASAQEFLASLRRLIQSFSAKPCCLSQAFATQAVLPEPNFPQKPFELDDKALQQMLELDNAIKSTSTQEFLASLRRLIQAFNAKPCCLIQAFATQAVLPKSISSKKHLS